MPEENPENGATDATRRFFAALNARDAGGVARMLAPAVVWDVSRWGLGTHVGERAIRVFLEDWMGDDDRYQIEIAELHEVADGVIFVGTLHRLPGARNSPGLRVRSASVFEWSGALVGAATTYQDVEEGRVAALALARSVTPR